jgi:phosphinothricin acetyltransferase
LIDVAEPPRIRLATGADAEAVLAIYAPVVESTAISFELVVPNPEVMADRIMSRQPSYPWLVAELGREIAGYAYAGPFAARAAYNWSVETSVYVGHSARGCGVGTGLYEALFSILSMQGYRQALAGISLPNTASVALHEKLGFRPSGVYRAVGWKLGAWHDVGWWQRPLGKAGSPPSPPRTLDEAPWGHLGTE